MTMEISKEFRYILDIIDTITRYMRQISNYEVTAAAATDALRRHKQIWNPIGDGHGPRITFHESN